MSAAARGLGIDRRTVKRWVDRGRNPWGYVRWKGIERRSTAPKHPRRALTGEEALWGRKLRERTALCREKLADLAQAVGIEVSASTIHSYLLRKGLIRPSTRRRRRRHQNGRVMGPRQLSGVGESADGREVGHPGSLRVALHLLHLCCPGYLLPLQSGPDTPQSRRSMCPLGPVSRHP